MRIVPAVEAELRREIRDARAEDPIISIAAIERRLEKKFNRGFSQRYIAKLAEKVRRQALVEADRTKIEERLEQSRETYRIARERYMKILCWEPDPDYPEEKPPGHWTTLEAGKNLVMMDLALLKAEIDCGLYKRPITDIAKEFQYERLPDEMRMVVIAAWKRGGMLPAAMVEEMVPVAAATTTPIH